MAKTNGQSQTFNPQFEEKLLDNNRNGVAVLRKMSNRRPSNTFQPPDGGWGWVVCFAAFWTNGIIFGVMNCFGVIFVKLKERFGGEHEEEAAFVTSWVGSVSIGMTFLLSPVASVLTDKLGIRITAFVGGLIATVGMLASSFVTSLELLYLTYGVLLGSGASLTYTPSLVILGHYFRRRLGLVNGLVAAGSSVFTMIMPLLLTYLLKTVDLPGTLQVLSLMMASLMLCALTFRPLLVQHQRITERDESCSSEEKLTSGRCSQICASIFNKTLWKNKKYLIWVFANPIALFGYFVPYVHLVQHVRDILPEVNGELLVTCIGLTSGLGRIIFGKIADYPFVNRIFLQQLALLSIGVLTMILVVSNHFAALIVICLFFGLFDGCFISLLGPIAFDLAGPKGASQAIGFFLGFCSIPLTVGPPVAGLLYDHLKNYRVAFLTAGIPPLIGSTLLCLIHLISKREQALALDGSDAEKSSLNDQAKTTLRDDEGNISEQKHLKDNKENDVAPTNISIEITN